MSRVGKIPVKIPSGVAVTVDGDVVAVQGPKGSLKTQLGSGVSAAVSDGNVTVSRVTGGKQARANYGTARSLINNMIVGVSDGWKKSLELQGVGYGAQLSGTNLTLKVGLSHEVVLPVPTGVTCNVEKTMIHIEACDKQLVGIFAAKIRKIRPPEPYLGKGIRYLNEQVRRKAGKTGK